MEKYKIKDLKFILEKWIELSKDFNNEKYELMGQDILDIFNKYNAKSFIEDILKTETLTKPKSKKKTVSENKEEILEYLLALKNNDIEKIKSANFKIILAKDNLIDLWKRSNSKEKLSSTKTELNIIYNYLYDDDIKYINKKKEVIIKDIDEFIYNKLRNNRIDNV